MYRVYQEHSAFGSRSKAFETTTAAVAAFNREFMQLTGNAWEGRANFCLHPYKYIFVSYNVNDPAETDPLPKLGFAPPPLLKSSPLPIPQSRERDASPKRQ
jgi:hypothetical protein